MINPVFQIKQVFLILLFCLFSVTSVFAAETVSEGDAFYIDLHSDESLFTVTPVEKNMKLNFSGVISIDVSGDSIVSAKNKIQEAVGKNYKIKEIVHFYKKNMIMVTVLGDVKRPGNYWMPSNASLTDLNKFGGLFNSNIFDSSVTIVRSGKRQVVNSDDYSQLVIQADDILLLSLIRRPEPKVEPLVDEASDQGDEIVNMDAITSLENGIESEPNEGAVIAVNTINNESITEPAVDGALEDVAESSSSMLDNYKLQPGDILTIGLPGEDGFNKNFIVDRSGVIKLPEVGQIEIEGKSLRQVETIIYNKLSVVYLGLDKLTVHLKEKRLLITVLGYVEKPGEVELPKDGNVQMAINEAGGLVIGAQLDKFQLQRNDTVEKFNFKRYLDTGDASVLPTLKSLDVVFIPSSPELGSVHGQVRAPGQGVDSTEDPTVVKVFGEVLAPGSFPYKDGMTLVDALMRAGGVTRYSNVEQIRVIDQEEPVLFNLKKYLDSGDDSKLLILSEGATIYVPKQVEAVQGGGRIVYVMGQVQKSGSFEIGANVGFLDVLATAGGPNRYADTRTVRILRANGEIVPFNLQDYTEGRAVELPKILPGDAIFIPQKGKEDDQSWTKVKTGKSIKLIGAIKKPGRYEWAPDITFLDLIGYAGGPTNKADLAHIKLLLPGIDGSVINEEFNLQDFFEEGGNWSEVPELVGGSTIIFPDLPESPTDNNSTWIRLVKEQAIYMMGAVNNPGRFAFSEKLGFLDILTAAQGPSPEADLTKVRIIHRGEKIPRVSHVNLLEYFETGDETLLPQVKSGDSIFIPSNERKWTQKRKEDTVRVLGAVADSGRYEFSNEMTILDLLAEAGGPTDKAFVKKIIIVNTSCCKNQAYTFDLMDFMKDPDASRLPVLRAGDTVYVPDMTTTYWSTFMEAVRDAVSTLSLIGIIGAF